MAVPRAASTDEILEAFCAWAAVRFPGKPLKRLLLYFHSPDPDDFVSLPLPPLAATAVSPPSVESEEPSTLHDAILELLSDSKDPLKGTTMASRLGRAYSGSFRATLKRMREIEEVNQDENGRYSLAK